MRKTFFVAFGLLGVSAAAADTPPSLSGRYTGLSEQFCQAAIINGTSVGGGDLEHLLATMRVTGTDFTLTGTDQSGSLATRTGVFSRKTVSMSGTITISGTANPYAVDLAGNAILANLDRIDANGVAHRATFLSTFSNGELPGTNCSQMVTFTRD